MSDPETKEKKGITKEFLDTPKKATVEGLTYVIAAFGLVAALAWNEAIKALINQFFNKPENNIISLFVYALIVTLVTVAATTRIRKIKEKVDNENKDEKGSNGPW